MKLLFILGTLAAAGFALSGESNSEVAAESASPQGSFHQTASNCPGCFVPPSVMSSSYHPFAHLR